MMIVSSISRYNEGLGCARPRSNETMIILTGGAGFIGSNLLGALNAKDVTDVMVVDRVGDSSRNLKDLRFSDLMRPEEFARAIERGILPNRIEAIFRSEEHTSELQSQSNLVCRLLLEKKKKNKKKCLCHIKKKHKKERKYDKKSK